MSQPCRELILYIGTVQQNIVVDFYTHEQFVFSPRLFNVDSAIHGIIIDIFFRIRALFSAIERVLGLFDLNLYWCACILNVMKLRTMFECAMPSIYILISPLFVVRETSPLCGLFPVADGVRFSTAKEK